MSKQKMDRKSLEELLKPKLVEMAKARGLSTKGLKGDLIDAILADSKSAKDSPAKKSKKTKKASTPSPSPVKAKKSTKKARSPSPSPVKAKKASGKKASGKKALPSILDLDDITAESLKPYLLADLKSLAESKGIATKGLKKADIVSAILAEAEDDEEEEEKSPTPVKKTKKVSTKKASPAKKASGKKLKPMSELVDINADTLKAYGVADLREFANEHDIDITGLKGKADILDIIVQWAEGDEYDNERTPQKKTPTPVKKTKAKKASPAKKAGAKKATIVKVAIEDFDVTGLSDKAVVSAIEKAYTVSDMKEFLTSRGVTMKSGAKKSVYAETVAEQLKPKKSPTPKKKTATPKKKEVKAKKPKSPKKKEVKAKKPKSPKKKTATPKKKTATPKKKTATPKKKTATPKKKEVKPKRKATEDGEGDGLMEVVVGDTTYVGTQEAIDALTKKLQGTSAQVLRKESVKLQDLDFDVALGVLSKMQDDTIRKQVQKCFKK